MLGFQEQNGYGRGQVITRSEVEQSASKIDTRPPCGCPSLYSHLATCKTANAALVKFLATLPADLPGNVKVNVDVEMMGAVVELDVEAEVGPYLLPKHARAVARSLLLAADEAERGVRG